VVVGTKLVVWSNGWTFCDDGGGPSRSVPMFLIPSREPPPTEFETKAKAKNVQQPNLCGPIEV